MQSKFLKLYRVFISYKYDKPLKADETGLESPKPNIAKEFLMPDELKQKDNLIND